MQGIQGKPTTVLVRGKDWKTSTLLVPMHSCLHVLEVCSCLSIYSRDLTAIHKPSSPNQFQLPTACSNR